jgi:hypothetical protein
MMAGTSPAITALPGGGWAAAFQANTGNLWTVTSDGAIRDTGQKMLSGTSPAITSQGSKGWTVAFQANTSHLWTLNNSGATKDTGYSMLKGTSPAITTLGNGNYEIAYQGSNGNLWLAGDQNRDAMAGMMAGTSPSIIPVGNSDFEYAFQANTGNLWTLGADGHGDWGVAMYQGTSPSIASFSGSAPKANYQVAVQMRGDANLAVAVHTSSSPRVDRTMYGMMAGTSPVLNQYLTAFQANTSDLFSVGHNYWGRSMMKGTSPALAYVRVS